MIYNCDNECRYNRDIKLWQDYPICEDCQRKIEEEFQERLKKAREDDSYGSASETR